MERFAKISIIGRGIDPSKHLSLNAIKALQKANKIVGIEPEKKFWSEIEKEFDTKKIESLGHLYQNEKKDVFNYQFFIQHILDLSSKFSHLALLVAGHPRFGVSFIEMLKQSSTKNLEIEIIDGISSFDVMTSFIQMDPLEQGTALIDANRLLLFQYKIEPALSYFIYHICSIGTSKTNFLNPEKDNRLDLLKNYLLKYYPENKEVALCRISNGQNEKSRLINSTIADLNISEIDFSTTLYIPANNPNQIDWNFLNLLR
ncbi:SAM-dependent methyltransferase [Parachlamydia acanthamoebae]|uniref:SAM-dependent methyltransferase n=1 Tax=Parachlamydia acanthamoebae TaxID=83552 RepID=UPI000750939C|nr:SAM-dependent methyltransferase [Parachlamydia acanthamoebae]